jgi:hypothetical protein
MMWIIALIFGLGTALIANSKGRNPVGWFFIGFIIGIIGLIIVLCMSNLNEERQYREQQAEENRRLREKLRQEQMKLESLRVHTSERLDSHDKALGMETRRTTAPSLGYDYGGGASLAPPPLPPLDPPSPEFDPACWYLVIQGQQHGPVSKRALGAMVGAGQINRNTLIWQESMPNWIEAGQVLELSGLFA